MVFNADYVSGEITIQPEEILDAKFLHLDETTMDEYIKRPHLKSRIIDTLRMAHSVPYETWNLNPPDYKLLSRIDGEQQSSKRVFLLTGKPRAGKSTLIKKLINEIGSETCGGFYTEEITNSINERIGFRCVSVDGESVEIARVESPSIEEFEDFALRVLQEAMSLKRIIVIDEIGFMQMLSPSFQRKVQEIIYDNRIVLGTVPLDSHPGIDKIIYNKEVQLVSVNESTRDMITEFLVKDIIKALDSNTL